jgi:hypothetical protein
MYRRNRVAVLGTGLEITNNQMPFNEFLLVTCLETRGKYHETPSRTLLYFGALCG